MSIIKNELCARKERSGSIRKLLWIAAAALLLTVLFSAQEAKGAQLTVSFTSSDGSDTSRIADGVFYYNNDYGYDIESMTQRFEAGTEITITSEEAMDAIYIEWYYAPDPWTLRINGKDYPQGQDGYVQDYIKIPDEQGDVTSVTMILGESAERIIDIYAFSEGTLPEFVHVWEDPYEEADILLVSTHADDEVLFFGGIIPNYIDRGNVRIQLLYFTDFFQTEPYRVQELLDGLWNMGVTHYPQLGEFYDYYSESYEEAKTQFDYDSCLSFMIRNLRRFKPQVVIGQDIINGEYGHGGHIWCANMIADALELTADEKNDPDSAKLYGTWDVPKTYFHLYPENQLVLDARVPLSSFGGRTALEIAQESYRLHTSQSSWMWFQVSDGMVEELAEYGDKLNCTKFGLYRTLVGQDTGANDLLENIMVYDVQAEEAALAEAQALEAQAAADAAAAEGAAADAQTGAQADAQANAQDANGAAAGQSTDAAESGNMFTSGVRPWKIILIAVLLVVAALIVVFLRYTKKNNNQKKKSRARQSASGVRSSDSGRSSSGSTRSSGNGRSSSGSTRTSSGGTRTSSGGTRSSSNSSRSSSGGTRSSSNSSRSSSGSGRTSSNSTGR